MQWIAADWKHRKIGRHEAVSWREFLTWDTIRRVISESIISKIILTKAARGYADAEVTIMAMTIVKTQIALKP